MNAKIAVDSKASDNASDNKWKCKNFLYRVFLIPTRQYLQGILVGQVIEGILKMSKRWNNCTQLHINT